MACFVFSASSFKVSARETLITCGYEKKKKISIEYPLLFDGVGNRIRHRYFVFGGAKRVRLRSQATFLLLS